jgi:hypothetical protein
MIASDKAAIRLRMSIARRRAGRYCKPAIEAEISHEPVTRRSLATRKGIDAAASPKPNRDWAGRARRSGVDAFRRRIGEPAGGAMIRMRRHDTIIRMRIHFSSLEFSWQYAGPTMPSLCDTRPFLARNKRTTVFALLALVMGLSNTPPARARGFGPFGPPNSFRMYAEQSDFVVYGYLENARKPADTNRWNGATDLVICKVVKNAPFIHGKKKITMRQYIPIDDPKCPPCYLVFCYVDKGVLGVCSAINCTLPAADYLAKLLTIDPKKPVEMLRSCFDYFEHADEKIAEDAHLEFRHATWADMSAAARKMSAEKLRRWLQNEKTVRARIGIYGLLLAHCGEPKDAAVIRSLISKHMKEPNRDFDQLLIANVLLDRKEGWPLVHSLASNPASEFSVRYDCLRAARYFKTEQRGVVPEKAILELVNALIDQRDMADLPIEDLRQWRLWEMTDKVLPLYFKKDFDVPIIKRCIIRYALRCPDAKAASFLAERRKADPEGVKDVEDLLDLEDPPKRSNP